MNRFLAHTFTLLQRILPRMAMTAMMYRLTRVRARSFKNWMIRRFVSLYKIELDEIEGAVPDDFASFNAFFIRELKAGSRPVADQPGAIVSPVDGTVSAAGRLQSDRLIQAKGITYTLEDLLATDLAHAERFADGSFATLYLAPYNYHRVHSPLHAQLESMRYIPGDLFSVNDATVSCLPGLFTRNERLVCNFTSNGWPMTLVFVGALHVGSITTQWTGEIRPRRKGVAELIDLQANEVPRQVKRGGLLGWFNMGSTVIILLPRAAGNPFADIEPGQCVTMGSALGQLAETSDE